MDEIGLIEYDLGYWQQLCSTPTNPAVDNFDFQGVFFLIRWLSSFKQRLLKSGASLLLDAII